MSVWVSVLGLFAAGVGTGCAIPQVVRLARSAHAHGLSFPSTVLSAVSSMTWLLYGLLLSDTAQVVANVLGLGMAVATVALIVRRRSEVRLRWVFAAVAGWAALLAVTASVGGPSALGVAATGVSLVTRWPQVVQVLRGGPLAALSPASLALSLVASGSWGVYGALVGQVPVWLCSVLSLVLTAVILTRRCPAQVVVPALAAGRWGRPGRVLVRPVVARFAA